ncbi:hypothetical protein HDV02_005027 [Globomyces sp. JEL0801]|nr:hypothetical protein HDV02_005027 [Globomyces sp. JEL0801]
MQPQAFSFKPNNLKKATESSNVQQRRKMNFNLDDSETSNHNFESMKRRPESPFEKNPPSKLQKSEPKDALKMSNYFGESKNPQVAKVDAIPFPPRLKANAESRNAFVPKEMESAKSFPNHFPSFPPKDAQSPITPNSELASRIKLNEGLSNQESKISSSPAKHSIIKTPLFNNSPLNVTPAKSQSSQSAVKPILAVEELTIKPMDRFRNLLDNLQMETLSSFKESYQEMDELYSQNQIYEKELRDSQNTIQLLQKASSDMTRVIEFKNQSIAQLELRLSSNEKMRATVQYTSGVIKSKFDSIQKDLEMMSENAKGFEKEISTLKSELGHAKNTIDEKVNLCQALQSQLVEEQTKYKLLVEKAEAEASFQTKESLIKVNDTTVLFKDLLRKKETTIALLIQTIQSHCTAISQLVQDHAHQLLEINKKNKAAIAEYEDKLKVSLSVKQQCDIQIQDLTENLLELKLSNESYIGNNTTLQKEIELLNKEVEKATASKATIERVSDAVELSIATESKTFQSVEKCHVLIQKNVDSTAQLSLDIKESHVNQQKDQYSMIKEFEIRNKKYSQQIDTALETFQANAKQTGVLEQQLNHHKHTEVNLINSLKQMECNYAEKSDQVSNLTSLSEELKSQIATLKKELEISNKAVDKVKEEMENESKAHEMERLKILNDAKNATMESAVEERYVKKISSLESEISVLKNDLRIQLMEMENSKSQAMSLINKMNMEHENELHQSKKMIQDLNTQHDDRTVIGGSPRFSYIENRVSPNKLPPDDLLDNLMDSLNDTTFKQSPKSGHKKISEKDEQSRRASRSSTRGSSNRDGKELIRETTTTVHKKKIYAKNNNSSRRINQREALGHSNSLDLFEPDWDN